MSEVERDVAVGVGRGGEDGCARSVRITVTTVRPACGLVGSAEGEGPAEEARPAADTGSAAGSGPAEVAAAVALGAGVPVPSSGPWTDEVGADVTALPRTSSAVGDQPLEDGPTELAAEDG